MIECSAYTITGSVSHEIYPVHCYTNSTNSLKALFLPDGFEFSDNKLQGTSSVPLRNVPVFIFCEKAYVKIFISSKATFNYLCIVFDDNEHYKSYFDLSTLYIYPHVYSDFYEYHQSFPKNTTVIQNPSPEEIHFDEQTMTISYFGEFNRTITDFVIQDDVSTTALHLEVKQPDFKPGVRVCSLRDIPVHISPDPDLFKPDVIDFCYHSTSFSFSHEDPRTVSSKYISLSALLLVPATSIYVFTIVSPSRVLLYLDHYSRPLFDEDNLGEFTHHVTIKLTKAYHLLRAYILADERDSFALYYHSVKQDLVQRLLADDILFLPPSAQPIPWMDTVTPVSLRAHAFFSATIPSLLPQERVCSAGKATSKEVTILPRGEIRVLPGGVEKEIQWEVQMKFAAGEVMLPVVHVPVLNGTDGIEAIL